MANEQEKLITLSWMGQYHTKLKEHLGETYYDKDEVDALLSEIESDKIQTVRGTKEEIESMDLTEYPNGTLFVMED